MHLPYRVTHMPKSRLSTSISIYHNYCVLCKSEKTSSSSSSLSNKLEKNSVFSKLEVKWCLGLYLLDLYTPLVLTFSCSCFFPAARVRCSSWGCCFHGCAGSRGFVVWTFQRTQVSWNVKCLFDDKGTCEINHFIQRIHFGWGQVRYNNNINILTIENSPLRWFLILLEKSISHVWNKFYLIENLMCLTRKIFQVLQCFHRCENWLF